MLLSNNFKSTRALVVVFIVASIILLIKSLHEISISATTNTTINQSSVIPWKWIILPMCSNITSNATNKTYIGMRAYISPLPYPGSLNNNLYIEILNPNATQTNLTFKIQLPESWLPSSYNQSITLPHGISRVVITGVDIPENARPGKYSLLVRIERICNNGSVVNFSKINVSIQRPPGLKLSLINVAWADGYAYPGIRGEKLIITLKNDELFTLSEYTVHIALPKGLYVSGTNLSTYIINENTANIKPYSLFELHVPIDISTKKLPGKTYISLKINATAEYKGASLRLASKIKIPIYITHIPILKYKPRYLGWLVGAAYPGEKDAIIQISIINKDKFTINNLYALIMLPSGIRIYNRTNYTISLSNLAIGYGDRVNVQTRASIDDILNPGEYDALIYITAYGREPSGAHGIRKLVIKVPLIILEKRTLNLKPLYINWSDSYAYPGELHAKMTIYIQSLDEATITNLILNISIPSLNIEKIIPYSNLVTFGSIINANTEFNIPARAKPGLYNIKITVIGLSQINNQKYVGKASFTEKIPINKLNITKINIITIRWKNIVIGKNTFYATPQILVKYWGDGRVESMALTIYNVSNAKLRGNLEKQTIVYNQALEPGTYAWLDLPQLKVLNSTRPVSLTILLNATITTPSGGLYNIPIKRKIILNNAFEKDVIRVSSIDYITEHLLPGARDAEIKVRLVNTAPEPIYILGINASSHFINAKIKQSTCLSSPTPPGQVCTVALGLSIPDNLLPGSYPIRLSAWYTYSKGDDIITSYQILSINIQIEDLRKYEPKLLIKAYWAITPNREPFNVLPGDIVPLQITIYNEGPEKANGVIVNINASNIGSIVLPLQSCNLVPVGSSCTLTAYVKISDKINAGEYFVPIKLTYIFNSYTVYKIVKKKYITRINIANKINAIKLVQAYWLTPPSLGERGAELALYILKDPQLVDSIKAIKLFLPTGLFNPNTNTSYVIAVPAENLLSTTQLRKIYTISKLVIPSLSTYRFSASLFIAKVGISYEASGLRQAKAEIYWVDRAGTLQVSNYTVLLPVIGEPSHIEVMAPDTARLIGGIANISIIIKNTGNMPLYNVYVSLIPTSYTAYPGRSVKYLKVMYPGIDYVLNYTLHYNPATFSSQPSYTFNALLAILYETATGIKGFYNTSVSIILRPPVELQLQSLKARWSKGSLILEGVVSNPGTEPAKIVSVEAVASGRVTTALIGDIDAGSEAPFRLIMSAPLVKQVSLRLIYHDNYGKTYYLVKTIPVESNGTSTLFATGKESIKGILSTMKMVTLILAIVAASSLIYLYRKVKTVAPRSDTL